MLKLYSRKRAERIICRHSEWIERLSERFQIPPAYIQAILYKEIIDIDLLDPVADFAVWTYWARYSVRKWLCQKGLLKRAQPRLTKGPLGKKDSSTGYGQIFAYVAINAINAGEDRGVEPYRILGVASDHRLSADNSDDRSFMWHRLAGDSEFNIAMTALNLICAAQEMNGHIDFQGYTEEEIKRTFTRYNANVRQITKYGEAAYRYYLRFSGRGISDA